MSTLRFVDLFAGLGGFREACRKSFLDLQGVAWCESDERAIKAYERAHDPHETFVRDVRDIRTGFGLATHGRQPLPGFDVLLGGFPCQTFSNVGKRQGLADERGQLFFEVVRILQSYKPRFFILENVQKISTIERGALLKRLVRHLNRAGYEVVLYDLMASDYGLPQQRRRLFFCGVFQGAYSEMVVRPPPRIPPSQRRYPTAWHLLERSMPRHHLVPPKTRLTVLRPNPKWQGDLQIDRALARPICATMAKWHRANQDNYYSATYVRADNPDPMVPPAVDLATEPIRRITPLEGLRLQGFDDHFLGAIEGYPMTATYRLIGNAVPVPLAQAVIDHWIGSQITARPDRPSTSSEEDKLGGSRCRRK